MRKGTAIDDFADSRLSAAVLHLGGIPASTQLLNPHQRAHPVHRSIETRLPRSSPQTRGAYCGADAVRVPEGLFIFVPVVVPDAVGAAPLGEDVALVQIAVAICAQP